MKSDKKRKIGKGVKVGVHTGSAIFSGVPSLSIFLIGTIVFGLIGGGVELIARLMKKSINKCDV